MNGSADDRLVEALLTPHRRRDREGRPVPPPEWWDLPPEALDQVHRLQLLARTLERALDSEGRSATVRAVMARLGEV